MTTVRFDKFFVQGLLAGMTVTEKMNFTSFERACKWAATVTEKVDVDYIVQNFVDVETGETARF